MLRKTTGEHPVAALCSPGVQGSDLNRRRSDGETFGSGSAAGGSQDIETMLRPEDAA